MKKNLLILATLIFFFCLGVNHSIQADAYTYALEVAEGDIVETPYALVLTKGYYIFGTFPYVTSKNNFKGDFSFYHVDSAPSVSINDVKQTGSLEISENTLQSDLIDEFNVFFPSQSIYTFGASIVRVHSSAVFFTNGEEYTLTIMGLLTEEPNQNTSKAGNLTHFSSIDHPLSITELQERYKAEDNVDGNITNRLQFETNYSPNNGLGSYYIIVKVSDSAGHETCAIDLVYVKDFIPPIINFKDNKNSIDIEVNTNFSILDIQNQFMVTDNNTPSDQIKLFYTDNFSKYASQLGTYTYSCSARDKDGNSTKVDLIINVVDTTKPTLSLSAGGNIIYADHPLSDSEILSLFKVTDNYDSLSNSQIQILNNTCTGIQGREYALTVSITDSSNNTQEQTFRYVLTDNESPIILVEKTLYLPLGKNFSNKEILAMLKEAGIISNDAIDVSLKYDSISVEKEGIYEITYIETLPNGQINEGKVLLNVFTPVTPSSPTTNTSTGINFWYFLFFIIPLVLIPTILIIRKKKYGKN